MLPLHHDPTKWSGVCVSVAGTRFGSPVSSPRWSRTGTARRVVAAALSGRHAPLHHRAGGRVGMAGLEPATSWFQATRAAAALHPEFRSERSDLNRGTAAKRWSSWPPARRDARLRHVLN